MLSNPAGVYGLRTKRVSRDRKMAGTCSGQRKRVVHMERQAA